MKSFMFSLAAATVALVLGCQNPDVNNPVAVGDNTLHGTIAKPIVPPDPNLIGFDQRITYTNPGTSREAMQAIGNVVFHITKVPTVPVFDDNLYDVQIAVAGEISRVSSDMPAPRPAPWAFGGTTKDRIRIPHGEKVVLAKTFVVQGAGVPTVLNMPFTLTESALAVRTMSLTKLVVPRLSGNQ